MRFTQEDTFSGSIKDPLSLNRFLYCVGNPILLIDMSGNSPGTTNNISMGGSGTTHDTPYERAEELVQFSEMGGGNYTEEIVYELAHQEDIETVENTAKAVSFIAGCTPIGVILDAGTILSGEDLITGEESSRVAAIVFVALPEVCEFAPKVIAKSGLVDEVLEVGSEMAEVALKNADEVADIAKVAEQSKTIDNFNLQFFAGKATNKVIRTTKEATELANKLGYKKINALSKGQAVYQKGNKYITRDVDSHIGGVWKMADSIKNLASKKTRLGTFDIDLNKIGD